MLTFPCGLKELAPHNMTEQERLALVSYHGWICDEGVWLNPNYPDYEYGEPIEIIYDWTLWINPDIIS